MTPAPPDPAGANALPGASDVPGAKDAPGANDARAPGTSEARVPDAVLARCAPATRELLEGVLAGARLSEAGALHLLQVTGADYLALGWAANALAERVHGRRVSFVVNRNINFTNVCKHKCLFCAFSVPPGHPDAYRLTSAEIQAKVRAAVARGCTEVCIQGGLHPDLALADYLEILAAVRAVSPAIHVHAFSPEEIHNLHRTSGASYAEILSALQAAGLGSVPGTAAEVLVDAVRARICPQKLSTAEWRAVIETAHGLGLPSTATLMYGHVETLADRVAHMALVRDIQDRTGGFTEFVPLPFMGQEVTALRVPPAQVAGRGMDDLRLFGVARLFFHGAINNLQVSWVKLGPRFAQTSLYWGVNDFSGTLMEENISRSAGAQFGEELAPETMVAIIRHAGRVPVQRTTTYGVVREY